jgi:hypothetical protein
MNEMSDVEQKGLEAGEAVAPEEEVELTVEDLEEVSGGVLIPIKKDESPPPPDMTKVPPPPGGPVPIPYPNG